MCTVLMTTLLVENREVITFSVHQDECTGESLLQGGWACKPAQETQSTKPGKKCFSLTQGALMELIEMSCWSKATKFLTREIFQGEWLNPSSPDAEASRQIS